MCIVMKFGGSSLATGAALSRVAGIVAHHRTRHPVVVVSAIGKTTDRLVSVVERASGGEAGAAARAVRELAGDLRSVVAPVLSGTAALERLLEQHVDELSDLVSALASDATRRAELADAVLSHGERISSVVMTWLLRERGLDAVHVDARDVIVTDDRFTGAAPRLDQTYARLRGGVRPLADAGRVAVLGGFIGRTEDGRGSTLGRGGSDYTASLVGAGVGAAEIQIWTDVDGVMTADPSVVPDARPVRHLSFAEASELAYFGARVLHPSTMLPAIEHDIPVRVLNSSRPEGEGTLIESRGRPAASPVKSIACKKGITVIDIRSTRMLMAHGFLAAIFAVFDRHATAVDVVSTSEVGVSLTIDRVERLREIEAALGDIAAVSHDGRQAIVSLVGDAIRETPGVAATVFGALRPVNVRMISQGSSRTNLSLVVHEDDLPVAIAALHAELFGP